MSKKLISIIITVHNGENYISSLIEKLLKNSYSNLEVVVGNDGSTDLTYHVLKKFAVHPRVRIIHTDVNIGAGAMRNTLLKAASGDYIAIQDADDDFADNRFSKLAAFLDNNENVDVVGSGCILRSPSSLIDWGAINVKKLPGTLDWFLQRSMVHSSVMMRKNVLSKSHYHERLVIGEDYFFLTCAYRNGARFANINEPLYIYNIEKSDLRNRTRKRYIQIVKTLPIIASLFPFGSRTFFVLLNTLKISYGATRSLISQERTE